MLVCQVLTKNHPAISYLPPFIKVHTYHLRRIYIIMLVGIILTVCNVSLTQTSDDMSLAHLYFFTMTTHINQQTADHKKKTNILISAIKVNYKSIIFE